MNASTPRLRWRRTLLLAAALLFVGEVLLPAFVTWLYRADVTGWRGAAIHEIESARRDVPLEHYVSASRHYLRWMVVALLGYQALAIGSRGARFAERFVPKATPGTLGAIRALVASVLLASVLWEDLPSSALLPRSMVHSDGVLRILYALPLGFDRWVASPSALAVFQGATAALLAFAAVGYRTRITVPLGAIAYLLCGGILRQYAWFYHTGLVPMYLLFVLSFTPCGDGFSLDRRLRERRGLPVPDASLETLTYGWARYLVWVGLALPYVEAGLSKLRRGGLGWAQPSNLKSILLIDTLNPMEFDWGVALRLVNAPDAFFWALGIGTLLAETGYGLVLFFRWARRWIPLLTIGVHLSIWLLQNVLFFDLILLQGIFYDWRPLGRWLAERLPALRAASAPPAVAAAAYGGAAVDWGRRLRVLAALLIVCWAIRIEEFPLTAMQMYSKPDLSGEIDWYAVRATRASGETSKAPIEDALPALRDGRYRRVVRHGFLPGGAPAAKEFLATFAAVHNATAEPGERITSVVVERWHWDYAHHPDDPRHGVLAATYGIDVVAAAGAGGR
jgi:hypothetical protein